MTVAWKPAIMTRLQSIRAIKVQQLQGILTYPYPHAYKVHSYQQMVLRLQEKVLEENLSETEKGPKIREVTQLKSRSSLHKKS